MQPISRRALLSGAAIVVVTVPALVSARAASPVRVGSKLDAEAALLGTIILTLLDAGGIPTVNRLRLGTTKILRSAIVSGEVDIYPEYTGNGAFFFNQDADPVWQNEQAGYQRVKQLDDAANHIVWLPPAPANNTWGIALRADVAKANSLATLEDFAGWANGGGAIKLAASAEFVESPAALPAFQKAYGFKLGPDQVLVLAGGDTSATERAAAEGTSGVNAAMVYDTDGAIAALELVPLSDTKHAQMVYAPSPIVRASVLADYPKIPGLLAPAFAALDGETLRKLNARIAVDGEDVAKVATDWLRGKGLLK